MKVTIVMEADDLKEVAQSASSYALHLRDLARAPHRAAWADRLVADATRIERISLTLYARAHYAREDSE